MLNDEKITKEFASALFEEGVFAVGFSYPVVPLGTARIRIQISAAHSKKQLDTALAALTNVRNKLKIISG
jgi:glycine C-acetyltransferase